jgi:DNA polymerase sigma
MDQAAVNTLIRFLESCLKEQGLYNASIAVFGSALTNTMGQESDIDLIIISSDFAGKNIQARGKMTMVKRNMFPSKVVALPRLLWPDF